MEEKEKKEEVSPIIGIDLGTSYSLASVYLNGNLELIPNEIGEKASPSNISFFDNNEKIVGIFGKERIIKNQKVIYNSKRFIGRRFEDPQIKEDKEFLPFKLIKDETKDKVKIKIEGLNNLEKDEYYPEEISAMILRKIKKDAEFYLKKEIKEAVITTPAYFNQMQRKATMQAAEIAGLIVRKIVNEPTAAAVAYAYKNSNLKNKTLVFDFGGGTLDLTLLTYSNVGYSICKVICSSGDTHLGGQDIDNKIYEIIKDAYKEQIRQFHSKYGDRDETIGNFRLLKACEKAKIILSELCEKQLKAQEKEKVQEKEKKEIKSTNIIVDSFLPTVNINFTLTEEKLDEIIKNFFKDKIEKCFDSFFKKAKIQKHEVENIIFVGGSSKFPKLRELIKDYFKKPDLNILSIKKNEIVGNEPNEVVEIEPNEVVALGAGIIAGQIKGEKDLEKFKLFDVTSLSLGTNLIGGKMDIIIPKNTHPPITKKKNYFTTVANQEIISNRVYEGEEEFIKDNYLLADFKIKNLTKRDIGKTGIELTFNLSSNFLLKVTAKELQRIDGNTNEQVNTVKLDEPKNVFKFEEINEMRNFINKNSQSDWQFLFDEEYKEKLTKLKSELSNTKEKYELQKKIVKVINDFLLIIEEDKKNINYYKIYSLYLVYYFHEINNLFKYKENFKETEIDLLIKELNLEKKIEIVKEEIKEIIWEIIDIFNENKLFYNYLKINNIEILLMNIQDQLINLDFSYDFIPQIEQYNKIIDNINFNLSEYKTILNSIEIKELQSKKKMCLENINKYEKKLEIKKFIIDFYSSNNNYDDVTQGKCNKYILNYFEYDLTLGSIDFLKLKEISFRITIDYYGTNLSEQNFQKYKNLINGKYHGKKIYTDDIDQFDDINFNENERAYKNLDKIEQDIIDIIHKAKESIEPHIKNFFENSDDSRQNKLDALFYIVKKFYITKYEQAQIFRSKGDLDGMIDFVRAVFTYDKQPDTIKEFETKVRDNYILNVLSSNGII